MAQIHVDKYIRDCTCCRLSLFRVFAKIKKTVGPTTCIGVGGTTCNSCFLSCNIIGSDKLSV